MLATRRGTQEIHTGHVVLAGDEQQFDADAAGHRDHVMAATVLRNDGYPRHIPHNIFTTPFANVYPMYVQKAERKGRTKDEVDQVIGWLTGYDAAGLQRALDAERDFETFFAEAPAMHPNTSLITGVVCGVRVEDVEDPLMQKIRWLDKLVDELAKGKAMDKILRR